MLDRELEKKRKEKAQLVYERKKQLNKLRVKAKKVAEDKLGSQLDILALVKKGRKDIGQERGCRAPDGRSKGIKKRGPAQKEMSKTMKLEIRKH
ncbi:hypothetical protein JHK82_040291 [Glycine max]|nr:hypothetical protein JHK82_040291 [Glycine max]